MKRCHSISALCAAAATFVAGAAFAQTPDSAAMRDPKSPAAMTEPQRAPMQPRAPTFEPDHPAQPRAPFAEPAHPAQPAAPRLEQMRSPRQPERINIPGPTAPGRAWDATQKQPK